MIKLFISHPQNIVCEHLTSIFKDDGDFSVVGSSADSKETLDQIKSKEIEIFLMSRQFADRDGLGLVKSFKELQPNMKIILYSPGKNSYLFNLMASMEGADGILPGDSSIEDIKSGIKKAANGKASMPAPSFGSRMRKLSRRETDILVNLIEGRQLVQISKQLGINDKTVSTYKNRLFRKLGVNNMVELMSLYIYG